MFWMVLIFLLLCAISGLLWFHYQQDRQWRQELERMENGDIDEWPYAQNTPRAGAAYSGGSVKAAYGKTIARLRLLAAKRQTSRPSDNETPTQSLDYVDDSVVFSEQAYHEAERAHAEAFAHNHLRKTSDSPASSVTESPANLRSVRSSKRLSSVPDPVIVPFEESDIPQYVPRKVQGAALEEITLEEATRSLSEAVMQEMAEQKHAQAAIATSTEEVQATPEIKSSRRPMSGLEVIDLNDPALRRTRERVLANVEEIHINPAQKPRIESTQNALRTAERETVIPVADIPSRWDEIDVEKIHLNLARQTAARSRLAAAVAPIQDYQPIVIQDDEILANLSQSTSPLNRRVQPIRRIDTTKDSVIPDSVVIEKSSAVVQPNKSQSKTSRFQNTEAFISRPAAPDATVVEPPVVPKVEPVPVNIPEPPSFKEPPALSLPEVKVSAHVSNHPARSLQDFLISETEAVITDLPPFQTAPDEPVVTRLAHEQRSDAVLHHEADPQPSENIAAIAEPHEAEVDVEVAQAVWHAEKAEPISSEPANIEQPSSHTPDMRSAVYPEPLMPSEMHLPSVDLLLPPQFDPTATQTEESLLENSITIEEKLAEFKVKVKVVDSYSGPVITRYEIEPDVGVRGSAVLNLEKDLARSLGVASIRVVETIPGKTCMGLELPNPRRQMIRLSEIFNSPVFIESKSKLTLALGQDITGEPVVTDLAKAPHLLVAGTTGSGKSVGVNAMILSMLYKASPEDVRMIMIDPKMLELSIYADIPHLLAPVVTDMKLAANALNWCVNEMEKRYRLMSHVGVRNLEGFNQKIIEAAACGEKIPNPFSLTPDQPEPLEKLPFIVVVVDEFADLMMTAGKKIEELIARLAQKARAAGIHLILATQRPSVDVITGLIKANIPTRIAFQVSSKIDSRTILDQMGAENLLGQGDMLFLPPGTGYPQRVHGAFASDDEVHRVVEYLKQFGEPDYVDEILGGSSEDLPGMGSRSSDEEIDPLYDEAVAVVVKTRKASISGVQRHLRIGYNRAARLIDQMEADGIVSSAESNGNRTVLAPSSSHLD